MPCAKVRQAGGGVGVAGGLEGCLTPSLHWDCLQWNISSSVVGMAPSHSLQQTQGLLLRGLLLWWPCQCPGDGLPRGATTRSIGWSRRERSPCGLCPQRVGCAAGWSGHGGQHPGLGAGAHSEPGGACSPRHCRPDGRTPGRERMSALLKLHLAWLFSVGYTSGLLGQFLFDGGQVAEKVCTGRWGQSRGSRHRAPLWCGGSDL